MVVVADLGEQGRFTQLLQPKVVDESGKSELSLFEGAGTDGQDADVRIRALAGRELGERIPHARYTELPGNDHLAWSGDQNRLVEEIRQFMGVSAPALEVDRILSTVLFTDIVDSTRRASFMGDRHWRSTLEAHHAVVRSELGRHRGREVKTTGDGFLALFDGPALRRPLRPPGIVKAVRPLDLESALWSGPTAPHSRRAEAGRLQAARLENRRLGW